MKVKLNAKARKILRGIQTEIQNLYNYHSHKDITYYIAQTEKVNGFSGIRSKEAEVDPLNFLFGVSDAPILRLSKKILNELELGQTSYRTKLILIEEITHFEDQLHHYPNRMGINYSFRERVSEELLADLSRLIIGSVHGIEDIFMDEESLESDRNKKRVYDWADKYCEGISEYFSGISDKQQLIKLRALAHKHGKERLVYAKKLIE